MKSFLVLVALLVSVLAEPSVYFKETFEDGGIVGNGALSVEAGFLFLYLQVLGVIAGFPLSTSPTMGSSS